MLVPFVAIPLSAVLDCCVQLRHALLPNIISRNAQQVNAAANLLRAGCTAHA
jgi:hypothetical protein